MARQTTRVTRDSLKHDAFFDFTSRATAFVSANLSTVLGVVGAIALAIVLTTFWSRSRGEKTLRSDLQSSVLVSNYVAGQYQNSIDLATQLQNAYGGTRAAVLAEYVKGMAQLQLGRYLDAEQSLRAYLDKSSKAPFYEKAARRSLAACLETQNRFADAAEGYKGLAATLTDDEADEALLDAARAYRLAGATEQARSVLKSVVEKDKSNARQARIELAVLDAVGATTPQWGATIPSPPVTPELSGTTPGSLAPPELSAPETAVTPSGTTGTPASAPADTVHAGRPTP